MRCWAVLSADIIIKALLLVLAALIAAAAPARAAEPNPLEFRAEGSFPVKYVETQSDAFHRNRISGEPFFALVATAHLMPDLNVSMFANGGHDPLTGFRDNDNTFMSFGANAVKRWGAFSVGASMEHTQFYQGAFGPPTNDANDANLFARYRWVPYSDFRITPTIIGTVRLDDALSVQRYTFSSRVDIEHRLFDSWWLVAMPRARYYDYVGVSAGRRDFLLAMLGGVKYEFNDNVNFTALAGYENNSSNVIGRNFDRFIVGASIDFSFIFGRNR